MAGIPYHALEGTCDHARGGLRCAVVDQLENPKEAKRGVTRILTPEPSPMKLA